MVAFGFGLDPKSLPHRSPVCQASERMLIDPHVSSQLQQIEESSDSPEVMATAQRARAHAAQLQAQYGTIPPQLRDAIAELHSRIVLPPGHAEVRLVLDVTPNGRITAQPSPISVHQNTASATHSWHHETSTM